MQQLAFKIYLKYFLKGWWCTRNALPSSLVGACVQEDMSSGGGGEARWSTMQGLLWRWFWPTLRAKATEMPFSPVSGNVVVYLFMFSNAYIFFFSESDRIQPFWTGRIITRQFYKKHITKYYPVAHSLRPVTCILLVDVFHQSIQLWFRDTCGGTMYEFP